MSFGANGKATNLALNAPQLATTQSQSQSSTAAK